MSLVTQITALAAAVRDKLNTMTPRLLPSGGTTGQVLSKSSATDYATSWVTQTKVTAGTTPPASPAIGDVWIDTN